MKSLKEAIAIINVQDDQMLRADPAGLWSQLLSDLKALYITYQTVHWRAAGDAYYGDHLLYQRIYEEISEEIDDVAERALGSCDAESIVEPSVFIKTITQSLQTLIVPCESAVMMYNAEEQFLKRLSYMIESMRTDGIMTDGIEDLLQGIASKHEEHIYLLSRRVKMSNGR